MGWIEVELGLLGMGCILARFWVTDCRHDKGVPVVLGSPMIKEVYKDASRDHYDLWPTVWKDLYKWNAHNEWFENGVLDDLYDSDDYDSDVSSDSQPLEIEFLNRLSGPALCLVQIVGWKWQW